MGGEQQILHRERHADQSRIAFHRGDAAAIVLAQSRSGETRERGDLAKERDDQQRSRLEAAEVIAVGAKRRFEFRLDGKRNPIDCLLHGGREPIDRLSPRDDEKSPRLPIARGRRCHGGLNQPLDEVPRRRFRAKSPDAAPRRHQCVQFVVRDHAAP